MLRAVDEPTFRKSSYSTTAKECVEVADVRARAVVRDTRNPGLGILAFPHTEWAALLGALGRPGLSVCAGRSGGST
ncbi:DUF397 domain-containing protein [Nocardiopsis prasina]|uniref:DUF397 domain-containing protein n=1 Tax=Nocardiopsis prasina TaxID=2015 RepID=UPI00034A9677|nr:DUF397 domain-containing protein [Nocardiopsis prasina]